MPAIDVDEYRKQLELKLGAAEPAKASRALAMAADPVAAGAEDDELAARVNDLIARAAARKSKVAERLDALAGLGSLEFLGPQFSPFQAEYTRLLRKLSIDPRATIRRRALERLALRQDPDARDLLIRGLEDPKSALVPEAVALQFLGHDDHGDVVPLAHRVFERASGQAREEALRILATDPSSESLLARLMTDKDEFSSVRRLSATALQELSPETFGTTARQIVVDDDDFNEIRSTALTALSLQTPVHAVDADLVNRVAELRDRSRSPRLKASSKRFLDTHGVEGDR